MSITSHVNDAQQNQNNLLVLSAWPMCISCHLDIHKEFASVQFQVSAHTKIFASFVQQRRIFWQDPRCLCHCVAIEI
jgi:hypothetical protein